MRGVENEDKEKAPARLGVADIRHFRAFLVEGERAKLFEELHRPRPGVVWPQVLGTWGLILAAWALCVYVSPLWLPLALVVVGSRQRALGNSLHDASHGNMLEGREANRRVGTVLCSLPMFEDFELYRIEHLRHHAYLGVPEKDPDFLSLPRGADGQPPRAPWAVYRSFLLDGTMFRKSLIGVMDRMKPAQRWKVLAWWLVALALLAGVAGPKAALSFAGLWMLARATTYHAIKVFAEVSDHIGLEPGSIIGYTRNLPGNWLSHLLHPHHDNYHLAHHLFPRIPLANLQRLHVLLTEASGYGSAHHCDTYFLGPSSVVRSWVAPKAIPALATVAPRQGSSQPRAA
jgi:fatty acid desaturase